MANPAHLTVRFRCALPESAVPARFGIVTACNPHDRLAPPAVNLPADERLRRMLGERAWPHFRVIGGNESFAHAEPGWGISASREDVLALGQAFHQAAVYWVDGDALWLCACDGSEAIPLGSWAARTAFSAS